MALSYTPLVQARENSTNAATLYTPGAGETAEIVLKISNLHTDSVLVRVFHDIDGSTYNEASALVWDFDLDAGMFLSLSGIKMDENGSLGYRSSIANALTATVYGIVYS